ncbi:MAG: TonB domain/peptidase M56 domain-containing protein, partial [Planctomycetota bacterium]
MSDAIEVLGWTLLHFVWQGAVVGVLAAMLLAALRRRSASARYLTAVTALGLMLLLPLGTIAWIEQTPPVGDVSPIFNTISMIEIPHAREDGTLALDEPPIKVERIGIDFENPPPADAVPLIPISDTGQTILEDLAEQRSAFRVESYLKPFIPWAVAAWLVGVGVLSLRLLASWLSVQRLRRQATQPASENWQAMLHRIAERLRVNRPVKLVESVLVEVPTVIGWLKPIILLPASAMTGLTAEQLEALLAHELAHVRRHDYLVNLLQTVVETLLFYHPAVWWVSRRIRVEREHCCDDLAVQVCGDGLAYAKALVALEELRAPISRFALGAADGSLRDRVQRVIALPSNQRSTASTQFAVVSGCLSIVLVAVFLTQSPRGQGTNPPKPEPVNSDRVIISGEVTTAENKPVADAEVFLPFDLSNGLPDQEHCEVTRTDENGRYQFEVSSREYFDNAIEGYSFLVWALRPGTGMGISIVERPKNGNREHVSNIKLQPGRPFVVRVIDPDGQSVADATIRPSGMDTPTYQYPVPTQFSKRMAVRTNSEGLAEMTEISAMMWFALRADTKLLGTQALSVWNPHRTVLGEMVFQLKRTARIKGVVSTTPRPKNKASGFLATRWNDMQKEYPQGELRLMVGAPNIFIHKVLDADRNFDLLVPEGLYYFEFDHHFDVQHGTTTTLRVDGDKVEIQMQPTPETRAEREETPAPNTIEKSDPEKRVIARVNGVPIREADVTTRYFEQLVRLQEQTTPEEFRKQVDDLIRRDLPRIIERKLLVAEAMKLFDAKQRQEAEEFIKRNLAEQVVAKMKNSGVTNREELQNWLRQRGTSLERFESEYKERFYAQQFLAKKLESAKTPDETEKLRSQLLLQLWQQAEVKSEYLPHRGEVRRVDRPNERVWINLGEADGIKRGDVFRVVSIPPNNDPAQPVVIQGKIEVIRIIDPNTSEARILESDNDGPAKGNEVIPAFFPDAKANGVDLRLLFPFRKPNDDKGRFVGRVRLKTEKPLPDLEKVEVPVGKVLDESLVFSKEGGLANVFVYLWKPTFKF